MIESHVPFTNTLVQAHRQDLLREGSGTPRNGVPSARARWAHRRRGGASRQPSDS